MKTEGTKRVLPSLCCATERDIVVEQTVRWHVSNWAPARTHGAHDAERGGAEPSRARARPRLDAGSETAAAKLRCSVQQRRQELSISNRACYSSPLGPEPS